MLTRSLKIKDMPVRWKVTIPIILIVTVGILIMGLVAGDKSMEIVIDGAKTTALNGYRDTVLNTLTTMMITGNIKEAKAPFFEQMGHIIDLRVIRAEALDKDFGKGAPGEYPKDDIEKEVIEKGKEKVVLEGEYIRGIYPYIGSANVMGRNCLRCHTVKDGTVLGAVSIKMPLSELLGKSRSLRTFLFLVGGIGILLLTGAVVIMVRATLLPLSVLTKKAEEIASGNLEVTIDHEGKDEIGQLAGALNSMVAKLKEVVTEVMAAIDNVASGSQQLSSGAEQMSQGTTEQAASAEEASSSVEEMNATIKQNADNASQTEKIALKLRRCPGERQGRVRDRERHEGDRVRIIDHRGDRAPDEPAGFERGDRGGPRGRAREGFRRRGRGSAKARRAEPDGGRRDQQAVRISVEVAEKAGRCWPSSCRIFRRPRNWCRRSARPRKEQTTGADQINSAIQQLNQVIQQNAGAAEEMSSTAEELSSQAEQLQGAIAFFKIGDTAEQATRRTAPSPMNLGRIAPIGQGGQITKQAILSTHKGVVLSMARNGNGNGNGNGDGDSRDVEFEKF